MARGLRDSSATWPCGTARRTGVPFGRPLGEEDLAEEWSRQRDLLKFLVSEQPGRYSLCEDDGDLVGYGRVVARPKELVPVVLAALDRIAKAQEPHTFGVAAPTESWWVYPPPAPARLPGALAELDHVLRPAAGAGPLPADATPASALGQAAGH